jgi:hypothetical protein
MKSNYKSEVVLKVKLSTIKKQLNRQANKFSGQIISKTIKSPCPPTNAVVRLASILREGFIPSDQVFG